jgi:hypothetical protein
LKFGLSKRASEDKNKEHRFFLLPAAKMADKVAYILVASS